MLLTVDIGNTDIVSVLYDNNKKKINSERISLVESKIRQEEGYFNILINKWSIIDCDIIISCVVPALLEKVKIELDKFSQGNVHFLNIETVSEFVSERKEVGADLIAVAYSYKDSSKPTIILDMGSASKIILVRSGLLERVSIMLGVKNNMQALASDIKQLPEVKLEFPKDLLGQNTVDAIQAGIMYSQYYGLKGYVEAVEEMLNEDANIILTGGIGAIFKDRFKNFTYVDELVNLGLYEIYMDVMVND